MPPNLLILAGTTEATALARACAEAGLCTTVSFAGRVARPLRQPLPQRVGGFGGVDGLRAYLRDHHITHLIDATHPFAAQMSAHAVAACAAEGVPLIALTRAPWQPQPGDAWQHVPDIDGAVAALDRPPARVLLAVGRMYLERFAVNPQHFYLLRLVDPPEAPPPFPDHHTLVSRGPFTEACDSALLQQHRIDLVVSKNAGGTGAYAKIAAARARNLPVLMIDRPALPPRREAFEVAEVMRWIAHSASDPAVTDLGV